MTETKMSNFFADRDRFWNEVNKGLRDEKGNWIENRGFEAWLPKEKTVFDVTFLSDLAPLFGVNRKTNAAD